MTKTQKPNMYDNKTSELDNSKNSQEAIGFRLGKKMEKILVVQVKNNSKQGDDFQLFETNIRSLYYTKESLIIKERILWPTDKPETNLRNTKLDKLFVRFL